MTHEPVALAFANTRSSTGRDRISTLSTWRAWVAAWPGLRAAGHAIDREGLLVLRAVRDDVQLVLRSAAGAGPSETTSMLIILELAGSASRLDLLWRAGRPTMAVPRNAAPAAVLEGYLARAALDLLLTGPPLAACQGRGCLRLFVASRPDRRWCDGAVCGNRARVRAHDSRRRASQR